MTERVSGKYAPLYHFLTCQRLSEIVLSFGEIEDIIDEKLPPSAYRRDEWWGNEDSSKTRHVQARAWQVAGYDAKPDREARRVRFLRRS